MGFSIQVGLLADLLENGLHVEKMVSRRLYECARLSIEHKTAICFG